MHEGELSLSGLANLADRHSLACERLDPVRRSPFLDPLLGDLGGSSPTSVRLQNNRSFVLLVQAFVFVRVHRRHLFRYFLSSQGGVFGSSRNDRRVFNITGLVGKLVLATEQLTYLRGGTVLEKVSLNKRHVEHVGREAVDREACHGIRLNGFVRTRNRAAQQAMKF